MGLTPTNLRSVSLPGSEMDLPSDEDDRSAREAGATYSRVGDLPLRIERCELLPLARDTTSGFTKISIVVRLTGAGHEGQGEDITWDQIDQIEQLRRAGDLSWLRGTRTFDEFSALLGLADLFPVEPIRESSRSLGEFPPGGGGGPPFSGATRPARAPACTAFGRSRARRSTSPCART